MRKFDFISNAFLIVAILLVSALQAPTLKAQDPSPTTEVGADLFKQVWSPYCPGVSLMECPSSQAQELREELASKIKNGESIDALRQELFARFGEKLRMEPKAEGREGLAYFIPWFAILLVASLIFLFWKKRHRTPKVQAWQKPDVLTPDSKASNEFETKVLQELNKRMN